MTSPFVIFSCSRGRISAGPISSIAQMRIENSADIKARCRAVSRRGTKRVVEFRAHADAVIIADGLSLHCLAGQNLAVHKLVAFMACEVWPALFAYRPIFSVWRWLARFECCGALIVVK